MQNDAVILVADDNKDDVCLLRYAFREAGLRNRIESVSDGREAIEYLRGRGHFADRRRFPEPDLLLLDLRMPRVDGFEVLQWLRRQGGLRHLPVVVLSGPESDQQIHRALDLGALSYYQKPLRFRDLVHMVRNEFGCLARLLEVAA